MATSGIPDNQTTVKTSERVMTPRGHAEMLSSASPIAQRNAPAPRGELREGPAGGADVMPDVALLREPWHVVEQKQGRVRPAMQVRAGIAVNNSAGLEREADARGTLSQQSPIVISQPTG